MLNSIGEQKANRQGEEQWEKRFPAEFSSLDFLARDTAGNRERVQRCV
jgi:hypothetical protein